MTRDIRSTRPARAAIAAVLALSATPLLAQEMAPSPVVPAPIAPAPIAPVAESAAPQVAPIMEAAAPAPSASAPVMAPAQPVVQPTASVEERKAEAIAQAETARAEAAPVPVQRAEKRPAVRTTTARTTAPTPAPAETRAAAEAAPAAPARAVAPPLAEAVPVEPTPVAPDMAASTPVEPAAVTPPVANDVAQADNSNEALTWGLAGGALLLLGAAGTMAMRRRRNRVGESAYRVDEGVTLQRSEGIVTVPEAALAQERVEPAFKPVAPVAAPAIVAAPAMATATRTPLAAEASHGSLEAMVDAPPSPANPFLTRSKRLRRAQFLLARQADGTERKDVQAASVAPQVAPIDRSQAVYRFGKEDSRRSGLIPRTR